MINTQQLEFQLLHKFSPVLYLHPNELTSPISLDDYIYNCELCVGGKKKKIQKTPFNKPEIIRKDKNVLIEKNKIKLPLKTNYDIIPDKYLNYCGKYDIPNRTNIDLVPIYGLVQQYQNYIDLIYIFNYYYNNPYKFLGIYVGGEHQADLEHIRIRIINDQHYDINNYRVQTIYYSAHSTGQGRWEKLQNIEWYNDINNGHPIIYVAKGSHANYPNPGTWYRIFGFANDKTSKKDAIIWKPDTIINLNNRDDLMSYHGDMGNNGVHDLNRNWNIPPSSNIYATFFYRFFYPLSKCCISRK